MKNITLLLTLSIMLSSQVFAMGASSLEKEELPKIAKVEVYKSERRMALLDSEGNEVKSYSVNLGFAPLGHKEQQGDGKTPEGVYTLNWKNSESQYHLSIHISYPNAADKERARELGVSPGGDIFIHGMPNTTRNYTWLVSPLGAWLAPDMTNETIHSMLSMLDWTNGCIAVHNKEMEEIYQLVSVPTKIEIFP